MFVAVFTDMDQGEVKWIRGPFSTREEAAAFIEMKAKQDQDDPAFEFDEFQFNDGYICREHDNEIVAEWEVHEIMSPDEVEILPGYIVD